MNFSFCFLRGFEGNECNTPAFFARGLIIDCREVILSNRKNSLGPTRVRRGLAWVAGFLILCCVAGPVAFCQQEKSTVDKAPTSSAHELRLKLMRELEQESASFDGVLGVAAKDLTSGEMIRMNAGLTFPQASSIKIAILIELLRQAQEGKQSLSDRVEIRREQAVGGSGIVSHFAEGGSAISLGDLAVLMIQLSDNSATNILIERIGMANVNATLAGLGFERTKLQRVMMDQQAQSGDRNPQIRKRDAAARGASRGYTACGQIGIDARSALRFGNRFFGEALLRNRGDDYVREK